MTALFEGFMVKIAVADADDRAVDEGQGISAMAESRFTEDIVRHSRLAAGYKP